jgi:hypothetical protein
LSGEFFEAFITKFKLIYDEIVGFKILKTSVATDEISFACVLSILSTKDFDINKLCDINQTLTIEVSECKPSHELKKLFASFEDERRAHHIKFIIHSRGTKVLTK